MLHAVYQPTTHFSDLPQNWREDLFDWLRHAGPKILIILIVSIILIELLRLITHRLAKFSKSPELPSGVRAQQLRTLAGVVYSVGLFVIIFLALMQVLPLFGINMGPLLASAGIAGLAIGFGAQTLVKDVINGFFILVENQYDVGDSVKVAGVQGTVESMTLRRTVLRDVDGTVHTIPNSQITVVSNCTRDWAQLTLHVPVAYDEDSDRVIKLLQEVGTDLRHDEGFAAMMVADPEVPGIDKVSPGQVDYLMLVKTRPGSQYPVGRELRRRIRDCFIKNHVKLASPQVFMVGAGDEGK